MPNNEIFADVHCHTMLKYIQNDNVDLWQPIGKPNILAHLLGVVRFTAADFSTLAKGEVQVVCVALTPPEQKTLFFDGNEKLLTRFSSFISRIPREKIKHYQSDKYDHHDLLQQERKRYLAGEKLSGTIKLESTGKKTKCRYKVVKNHQEVEDIITANQNSTDERVIAIVFTIESVHALGTGHINFNGTPNKFNVSEDLLLKRVDALKGIGSAEAEAWEQSPFWVTMAHAFNNSICGHSQPLTKELRMILDYAEPFASPKIPPKYQSCINTGFTPMGKKVLERLLGIDAVSSSRSNPGRRIQIDIKHMSTKSRKEYYDIIDAYNAANPSDIIPVIMSHAAVNGKPSLDDAAYCPNDSDAEYENSTGLNPWSINLYDDEIIRIHQTKGFIGLIFYEPILGGKKRRKGMFFWNQKKWADLFADQIEHIVRTVYKTNASDRKEIWNRIGIGSDFDGQINPVDKFATADELSSFKKFLRRFLNEDRFDPYREKSEVNELADKICFKNVMLLLKNHYKG